MLNYKVNFAFLGHFSSGLLITFGYKNNFPSFSAVTNNILSSLVNHNYRKHMLRIRHSTFSFKMFTSKNKLYKDLLTDSLE